MSDFNNYLNYVNFIQTNAKVVYREISSRYYTLEDFDNGDRIITAKDYTIIESPVGVVKFKICTPDDVKEKLIKLVDSELM